MPPRTRNQEDHALGTRISDLKYFARAVKDAIQRISIMGEITSQQIHVWIAPKPGADVSTIAPRLREIWTKRMPAMEHVKIHFHFAETDTNSQNAQQPKAKTTPCE